MNTVGYGLIEMTEERFYFQFRESYTNKVLDEYEIDKASDINIKRFLIVFFLGFTIIFLTVLLLWKKYDSRDINYDTIYVK